MDADVQFPVFVHDLIGVGVGQIPAVHLRERPFEFADGRRAGKTVTPPQLDAADQLIVLTQPQQLGLYLVIGKVNIQTGAVLIVDLNGDDPFVIGGVGDGAFGLRMQILRQLNREGLTVIIQIHGRQVCPGIGAVVQS